MNASIPKAVVLTADAIGRGFDWNHIAKDGGRVYLFVRDRATSSHVAASLPEDLRPAPVGDELNAVAHRIANEVIDLDSRVLKIRASRLWDASDLGERNPLVSRFFFHCCATIALLESLERKEQPIVIVDDPDVGVMLVDAGRRAGHSVLDLCHRKKPQSVLARLLPRRVRTAVSALRVRLDGLARLVRERRVLNAACKDRSDSLAQLRNVEILLVTWGRSATFPPGEPLTHDPYYGPFPGFLRQRCGRLGYLANPTGWIDPFSDIAKNTAQSADPIILLHHCITPLDAVRAAFLTLFFPLIVRRTLHIAGHDLSPVLRLALHYELVRWRQTWALLYDRVGKAMHACGVRPKLVVHLYENQPWEKLLRAGIRRHLPETRIGAFQHAPFAELYLSQFASRRDIAQDLLPDRLFTIGQAARQQLAARGYPEVRLKIGGAWRFERLFALESGRSSTEPNKGTERTVLCCTSIDYSESEELLEKAVRAARGLHNTRLLVNFHPATNSAFRETLKATAERQELNSEGVQFTEQAARDLLPDVDAVLYHSSAVAYEALAIGIPIIFVGRDVEIDIDKVEAGLSIRCRTSEEIRDALEEAFAKLETSGHGGQNRLVLSNIYDKPCFEVWEAELAAAGIAVKKDESRKVA